MITAQSIAPTLPLQPRSQSFQARFLRALYRKPTFLVGWLILLVIVLMAIFANVIYPADPKEMVTIPTLWPGEDAAFPLGTDSLGRDVAAGIVYGSRASLLVGF